MTEPDKGIYLAGPEVFLRDAVAVGERKKAICRDAGFVGLFPLDVELAADGVTASAIYRGNRDLLRKSRAVIANLTPWRGSGADVGTVAEVVEALVLGIPVFAYVNVKADLAARIVAQSGLGGVAPDGRALAGDGYAIEDFGLFENLMVSVPLADQGWDVVRNDVADDVLYSDTAGFSTCVAMAKDRLSGTED